MWIMHILINSLFTNFNSKSYSAPSSDFLWKRDYVHNNPCIFLITHKRKKNTFYLFHKYMINIWYSSRFDLQTINYPYKLWIASFKRFIRSSNDAHSAQIWMLNHISYFETMNNVPTVGILGWWQHVSNFLVEMYKMYKNILVASLGGECLCYCLIGRKDFLMEITAVFPRLFSMPA